jgi:sugar phosphate isomerase/epimerase
MRAMRAALSTILRAPRAGPREIVARLSQLGAEAIALDPTLPPELAEAIEGLPIAAVAWRGRPRLCAGDKAERLAAVDAAQVAVRLAGSTGAGLCVVALGNADVRWDPVELARRFARDEWSAKRLLEERRSVVARHVDAVRFAIERLIPIAERESARIGIVTRAQLVELPDAEEAAALLDEFRGAPIGYWHDTASAYREELLGGAPAGEWLALNPIGANCADSCGLGAPLAPGLGEIDFTPMARVPLVVIEGSGSDSEISSAVRMIYGLPKP